MAARRRDELDGLVDSTEVMREALSAVVFAVFVVDETGRYCDAFSPREDSLLVPAREMIGMSVRDFLPASRAAEVEGLVLAALDSGEEQTTDFAVETPTGKLHLAASIRRLHSPRAPRVLIVLRDLTVEEELGRQVRESERLYRSLLDNAPDAIFVIDVTNGSFSEVNQQAVELFGIERARLLTLTMADVSPPTQPGGQASTTAMGERLAGALAGDRSVFEWTVRDAKGLDTLCQLRFVRMPLADRVAVLGSAVVTSDSMVMSGRLKACRARCRELATVELRALVDELAEVVDQVEPAPQRARVTALVRAMEGVVEAMIDEVDRDDAD